jgi:transposase
MKTIENLQAVLFLNWLHNHGIHVIEFSPHTPDLNPMENLWIELEKRVEKHNATTLDKLQDAIAEEWDKTSIDFLKTLSHRIPHRCQTVIDVHGQHTMY